MKNFDLPALGAGIGLRHKYFEEIIETRPAIAWFEIIAEDFLDTGGWEMECLNAIAKNYPLIGHGVCLSIGSTDPLDLEYLKKLKVLLDHIKSPWASDHLCFTMVDHTNLNELIPLPFTKEAVDNCVERIKITQDVLERKFLIENVTRYITVSDREMPESTFIREIAEGSNCGLLLDVTNVYLNAQFHKLDPFQFIKELPTERVAQIHLAGSERLADGSIIDSHDAPVADEIWKLFEYAISLVGPTSVLIERDKNFPPLSELIAEARLAEAHMRSAISESALKEQA